MLRMYTVFNVSSNITFFHIINIKSWYPLLSSLTSLLEFKGLRFARPGDRVDVIRKRFTMKVTQFSTYLCILAVNPVHMFIRFYSDSGNWSVSRQDPGEE